MRTTFLEKLLVSALAMVLLGLTGCRCCPGVERYAATIDAISDHEGTLDRCYRPTCDISRAGKPDWCSRCNRRLAACRCECQPPFQPFSDEHLYPPRYESLYPGDAFGRGIVTSVTPR